MPLISSILLHTNALPLQSLLAASHTQKSTANALFSQSSYSQAISSYDAALASCPSYLDYEIAVLKSNISACHLKLSEWKEAIDSATAALDALQRLETEEKTEKEKEGNADDAVIEIDADSEEAEKEAIKQLETSDKRRENIQRIRTKTLMRRAQARSSLSTWANLQSAEEDYKAVNDLKTLGPIDQKIVTKALRELPSRIQEARDKEMGDMMGKLKELGNGILKPFGMSTEDFRMVKDEKTGGYSMSFGKGG